jgi:hypothetical protein
VERSHLLHLSLTFSKKTPSKMQSSSVRSKRTVRLVQFDQKNCSTSSVRSKRTVRLVQFDQKNCSTSSVRSKRTVRERELVNP